MNMVNKVYRRRERGGSITTHAERISKRNVALYKCLLAAQQECDAAGIAMSWRHTAEDMFSFFDDTSANVDVSSWKYSIRTKCRCAKM